MIRNNRGWSLKEMLFLSAILLFFVLLVAVLINKLYDGLSKNTIPNTGVTYEEVEKNLKEASMKYYEEYKTEIGNIITTETLLEEKFISISKLTVKNEICEGYVIINNKNFTPYIKCPNYETKGY